MNKKIINYCNIDYKIINEYNQYMFISKMISKYN